MSTITRWQLARNKIIVRQAPLSVARNMETAVFL